MAVKAAPGSAAFGRNSVSPCTRPSRAASNQFTLRPYGMGSAGSARKLAAMQQRYVGNSGLRVSALSLGTMSWAGETDEQDAAELLRTFLNAGGRHLDTAASYADGRSEAMIGSMLGDVVARTEISISTKAGMTQPDGRRGVDTSRNTMLSGLEASLARLGTAYVEIRL